MTKRREPLTYHRALTRVAALIGWDRCGAICGVTERAVRYWSDPDAETEIRLIDAERLDKAYLAAGGDHAPFHRLYALRLDIAAAREGQVSQLAALVASSARETGEAIAALVSVSGHDDDPALLRAATAETEEAIEILTQALAALTDRGN
ncbi:hypothetical protein [Novosphingobium aquae]|uniref:Uncharacterized protein n=1 Tax=Novosphingobium aquae TaxID=3133435 RepID=A0ABU8S476_9SPHN